MRKQQQGFITLFFILGLSFTFITWISLSSERVFEYVHIKESFAKHRSVLHEHMLCADAFITILINSRHNLSFPENTYTFKRNLYFSDNFECSVKSIGTNYENGAIDSVFFTIGDFRFEYRFKNGFVNSIKSSDLF